MFEVLITRGTRLLSSMGTFFNKYFPFREYIVSLTLAQEYVASQLSDNLVEISDSYKYKDAVLKHNERFYKLRFETTETFYFGEIQLDKPFLFIQEPKMENNGFLLPETFLDVEVLQDKIENPSVVYKKNTDFFIKKNVILFHKDVTVPTHMWGKDVKFKFDFLQKNVGFLFFEDSDDITGLQIHTLLRMLRYGIRKTTLIGYLNMFFNYPVILDEEETVIQVNGDNIVTSSRTYEIDPSIEVNVKPLNTYKQLTPLLKAVTLREAACTNMYYKEGKIYTPELVQVQPVWGEAIGGVTIAGSTFPQMQDIYLSGIGNSIIYVITIRNNIPIASRKKLSLLDAATPPWVILNYFIEEEPVVEEYNNYEDTDNTINLGHTVENRYSSYNDGGYNLLKWGEFLGGEGIAFEKGLSPILKITEISYD